MEVRNGAIRSGHAPGDATGEAPSTPVNQVKLEVECLTGGTPWERDTAEVRSETTGSAEGTHQAGNERFDAAADEKALSAHANEAAERLIRLFGPVRLCRSGPYSSPSSSRSV